MKKPNKAAAAKFTGQIKPLITDIREIIHTDYTFDDRADFDAFMEVLRYELDQKIDNASMVDKVCFMDE